MPCLFFLSEVLPYDSKARRVFVTNGGLKRVQEIQADPGSALQEYISSINSCFSEDIVRWEMSRRHTSSSPRILVDLMGHAKIKSVPFRYYTPDYVSVLLDQMEDSSLA